MHFVQTYVGYSRRSEHNGSRGCQSSACQPQAGDNVQSLQTLWDLDSVVRDLEAALSITTSAERQILVIPHNTLSALVTACRSSEARLFAGRARYFVRSVLSQMASNNFGHVSKASFFILTSARSKLLMCKLNSSFSVIASSPSMSIMGRTTALRKI